VIKIISWLCQLSATVAPLSCQQQKFDPAGGHSPVEIHSRMEM